MEGNIIRQVTEDLAEGPDETSVEPSATTLIEIPVLITLQPVWSPRPFLSWLTDMAVMVIAQMIEFFIWAFLWSIGVVLIELLVLVVGVLCLIVLAFGLTLYLIGAGL